MGQRLLALLIQGFLSVISLSKKVYESRILLHLTLLVGFGRRPNDRASEFANSEEQVHCGLNSFL